MKRTIKKNNDELHEELIKNCNEAKKLVKEFQQKMIELQEKSISEYGALLFQVYAPVEIEWRKKTETFIDSETNIETYRYYLSDIKIVPLTLIHNGRLKK